MTSSQSNDSSHAAVRDAHLPAVTRGEEPSDPTATSRANPSAASSTGPSIARRKHQAIFKARSLTDETRTVRGLKSGGSGDSSAEESPEIVTVASSRESSMDARETPLQRTGLSFNMGRLHCARDDSPATTTPTQQIDRKRTQGDIQEEQSIAAPLYRTDSEAKRRRASNEAADKATGGERLEAGAWKRIQPALAPVKFRDTEHVDMEKIWHTSS
eukprot:CAMPEP_0169073220 /NCGR_PEP_ID=MMETSP1015-20121227/6624_1 /TAXON_ID=342587 /ORGANISM="Karlodinium micrum, Strain CCMP2283" /LENGTH=214 /DNA_ID=CAMNT_0009132453 /DNA_START=71 /DNA_END=715 /DNA_ORIENTATION=+